MPHPTLWRLQHLHDAKGQPNPTDSAQSVHTGDLDQEDQKRCNTLAVHWMPLIAKRRLKEKTMNVTLTTSSTVTSESLCKLRDSQIWRDGFWGYVLRCDSRSGEGSGRTKNCLSLRLKPFLERLEILAVVKGLERLKFPCEVLLRSCDQQLLEDVSSSRFVWREQGWKESGENTDLWQRLDEAAEIHTINTQLVQQGWRSDPDMKRCHNLAYEQEVLGS
jgi:ribonuclease HI